jgi:hypothetical protein
MKELLAEVNHDLSQEERKFLPQTPRGMSSKLVELVPSLRKRGVICGKDSELSHGYRKITISRIEEKQPETADTESAFSFLDK